MGIRFTATRGRPIEAKVHPVTAVVIVIGHVLTSFLTVAGLAVLFTIGLGVYSLVQHVERPDEDLQRARHTFNAGHWQRAR